MTCDSVKLLAAPGDMGCARVARGVVVAAIALLPGAQAWAINKCVGPDGKVSYQEGDCPAASKAESIKVPEPPPIDPNENVYNAAIARGRIMSGMTAAQVRRAWGSPTKINRSTGSYGTRDQWVYDRGGIGNTQYVYLDNGIVTGIQSPQEK